MEPTLFGYEDYKVTEISYYSFGRSAYGIHRYGHHKHCYLLMANDMPEDFFETELRETPELIKTAKSLYIHSSCTIARDLISKKFKRCLNIATADAVVIPRISFTDYKLYSNNALFINEEEKCIILIQFYDGDNESSKVYLDLKNGPKNQTLYSITPTIARDSLTKKEKDATLLYTGKLLSFTKAQKHYMDLLTYMIPRDKLVCESTVLRVLGDNDNAPTIEAMINIYDMLSSTEDSMKALGLKTLASLDYANYPQSAITILKNTSWDRCKAKYSTAVKYMLNFLRINTNRRGYTREYTDRYIKEKDYNIVEKLVKYIYKFDDSKYMSFCYDNIPFVYVDENHIVHPRLK